MRSTWGEPAGSGVPNEDRAPVMAALVMEEGRPRRQRRTGESVDGVGEVGGEASGGARSVAVTTEAIDTVGAKERGGREGTESELTRIEEEGKLGA